MSQVVIKSFERAVWTHVYPREYSEQIPVLYEYVYGGLIYSLWYKIIEFIKNRLGTNVINRFPWKTYWNFIVQKSVEKIGMTKTFNRFQIDMTQDDITFFSHLCSHIQNYMQSFILHTSILSRFVRHVIIPYYTDKIYENGKLIIRNRKDKKPDISYNFRFKKAHPYWSIAMFGHFEKDRPEKNTFILPLHKIGTTYEALELYTQLSLLRFPSDKMKLVDTYLSPSSTSSSSSSYDFSQKMNACLSLFRMFCEDNHVELVQNYIMTYINKTLYNKSFKTIQRMKMFIQHNTCLAEYIWETNFSTEKERKCLGIAMDISSKQLNGFVKSQNLTDLQKWISQKQKPSLTKYDKIPIHLQQNIDHWTQRLEKAKYPHVLTRYISSDEINICERNLFDAWRKADQWIGQHKI